ncbi:MAG: DUF2382 domain-containing protein [Paracoccaceae bacterium]
MTEHSERNETRLPLGEERLRVETREVSRTVGHVRLRTHEEQVEIAEPLRRESVEIERVPVGTLHDRMPQVRTEGDTTVIPVVEEVLVTRFRVVEEVRLTPRTTTQEIRETVTLRRQEASLDEAAQDLGDARDPAA